MHVHFRFTVPYFVVTVHEVVTIDPDLSDLTLNSPLGSATVESRRFRRT